jgi:hypothetical protein
MKEQIKKQPDVVDSIKQWSSMEKQPETFNGIRTTGNRK